LVHENYINRFEVSRALDANHVAHFFIRENSHVEAISNLAATLLSLNRREEAEQHWLRSVKLRPSYFEAVEHLISLLCGDHRGNEAVSVIDFVERSLYISNIEEQQGSECHGIRYVTKSDAVSPYYR
jgi:hypothetical protein